jgi:RNA polymerase sigma-70 factor (ECF subfamily)
LRHAYGKRVSPNDQEVRLVTDWDRIVREHGPMVFGTAWRILGHVADTEDVVQEVFLHAHQYQQTRTIRCWPALLRRLSACRALDRLRQRRATLSLNGIHAFSPLAEPDAIAVANELADRLRQAIARLPQREGAVFCLRYFEDQTNPQIAEALSISCAAVATALHKARAKLEALLTEPSKETSHEPHRAAEPQSS